MFGLLCDCSPSCYGVCALVTLSVFYLWRFFQGGRFTKNVRIDGKVVIITGANTGIGLTTALGLAKQGGKVYLAGRDAVKCESARQDIISKTGNQNVFTLQLDLASLQSVREFVDAFHKKESRLDILVNNAGVMMIPKRTLTADGFEMQFGVNHLGHFLLTNLLLDTIKASAPSRIVNVSSRAHYGGSLERDNLQGEKSYSQFWSYRNSKLANVLFTRELAKRLVGTGVTANSLHPGAVKTELMRYQNLMFVIFYFVRAFFFKTVWAGAQTTLAVALDPALELVSGKYFSDCVIKVESQKAMCDESAEWLWTKSEELVGLSNKKKH